MSSSRVERPLVSVVMPVFNASATLGAAVMSVLDQSFHHFELIVVDDGSTDATPDVLATFDDARMRVFQRDQNLGLVASLQEGIEAARAPIIARLDGDDRAYPDRLARQLEILQRDPEIGLVVGGSRHVDPAGRALRLGAPPPDHASIWFRLLFGNCLSHPTATFRRQAYEDAGGYRAEWFPIEDYDLWLRMAKVTRIAAVTEPLVEILDSPAGISMTSTEMQRERSIERSRIALADLTQLKPPPGLVAQLTLGSTASCRDFTPAARLTDAASRAVRSACRTRGIPTARIADEFTVVLRPSRFRASSGRRCVRGFLQLVVRHPLLVVAAGRRRLRRRRR